VHNTIGGMIVQLV